MKRALICLTLLALVSEARANPMIGDRHAGTETAELSASLSNLDLASEQVTGHASTAPRFEIEIEGRAWLTSWLAANLTAAVPDTFGSAASGGEATVGGSLVVEGSALFTGLAVDRLFESATSSGSGSVLGAEVGVRRGDLEVAAELASDEFLVTATLEF